MHLLLDIANVALFVGLDDLRDRTFDVLFSLPINPACEEVLGTSLHSQEGVAKLTELLKSPLSQLNLHCSSDKASEECQFDNVTQQLYFLQVNPLISCGKRYDNYFLFSLCSYRCFIPCFIRVLILRITLTSPPNPLIPIRRAFAIS